MEAVKPSPREAAPAKARTTPEVISAALREDISRGKLAPGTALRQDELAARFGVSRIPVREALRRLEETGLVTVEPNRGATVALFTKADVVEVFDLRELLEVDLMKRAVSRFSEADLRALEEARRRAEKGARTTEWSDLDSLFHQALYAPAQRARQLALIMNLRGLFRGSMANQALPARTADWLRDHRAIVAACRERDRKGAVRLLEDHLRRAAKVVLGRLDALAGHHAAGSQRKQNIQRSKTMLEIRPNCECCDRDLPNGDPGARICTFECTFCASCAEDLFQDICPNCGGDFVPRPTRPDAFLEQDPPSRNRVLKFHPERARLENVAPSAKPGR